MSPKQFSQHMARMQKRFDDALNKQLPDRIANRLVSAFKQNFQDEAFFGKQWPDVKRRTNPTKKQARSTDSRRKILTGRTGNLRRSVQYETKRGEAIIFSDLPYSAAHNDGTTTAGRSHHTTIPQRQFIGDSPTTNRIIEQTINQTLAQLDKMSR